jgi:hypothetical protein
MKGKVVEKGTTAINIVDECGNIGVVCLFMFLFSYKHFKIGGEWKRMVVARRIDVGDTEIMNLFI